MYSVEKIEVTLTVPSVEETAAWYERVLGWVGHYDTFDAEGRCVFGSVSRESTPASDMGEFKGFNLSRASAGGARADMTSCESISAWIFVDDVDGVYAKVIRSGVTPDLPPQDQPWGGKMFSMRDVNGLRLAFIEMAKGVTEP